MKLILQITLGVCLGIMLSAVLSVALWGSFFLKLLPALSTPVSNMAINPPVLTPPTLTSEKAIAERLLEPNPDLPLEKSPIAEANNSNTAVEAQARQQQLLAEQQDILKKKTFKAQYPKSPDCESPNDKGHKIFVDCANKHIKDWAKFEADWQQGKFKN